MLLTGESVQKADVSLRSPTTTNGVVLSPTGRTWRSPSPSPVYAYRTGWLPPSKPASRNATSPLSPQQHTGQVNVSPSNVSTSAAKSRTERPPKSSASSLKIDLTAANRQQSRHTGSAVSDGHVDGGVVNGYSRLTSSSSPERCDGATDAVLGREKGTCSASVSYTHLTLPTNREV